MSDPPVPDDYPRIEGYTFEWVIGRGGMGVVYKAWQAISGRSVAIKMIRGDGLPGPREKNRFWVEAEAVALLDHPNIVRLLHPGEVEGQPYLVLEYVDGGTLGDRKKDEPAEDPISAARLVSNLAEAMAHAHSRGVFHRDLKPANILMTKGTADEPSIPKIVDFGLAHSLGTKRSDSFHASAFGTYPYMSPEQTLGENRLQEIGAGTDVWSLGVIFYERLVGHLPFLAETPEETEDLIASSTKAVSPRSIRPEIPLDLDAICRKCLEKDPRRRYPTARELADDLKRFLRGEPISARPVGRSERLWKWARRKPLAASLIGVAAIGAALAVVALIAFGQAAIARSDALAASAREESAQARADTEVVAKKAAEKLAEERRTQSAINAYHGNIMRSVRELAAGHLLEAEGALADCWPEDGEDDLRDFEWYHLRRRLNAELFRARRPLEAGPNLARPTLSFAPDSSRLFVAPEYAADLTPLATEEPQEAKVEPLGISGFQFLAISPDGSTFASRSIDPADRRIYLLKTRGFAEVGHFGDPGQFVHSAAFSPDNRRLATCSGGIARVWEIESGRLLGAWARPDRGEVYQSAVAFDPTGEAVGVLFWGDQEGDFLHPRHELIVWDIGRGPPRFPPLVLESLRQVTADPMRGRKLAFRPDGRQIAAGLLDRSIRLIDATTGRPERTLAGHESILECVAYFPDGRRLVSGGGDKTIRIWDLSADDRPPIVVRAHDGRVLSVAVSPDGLRIASTDGWMTRVWDASRLQGEMVIEAHHVDDVSNPMTDLMKPHSNGSVDAIAIDPGSKILASGGRDGVVKLWDARSGRPIATLPKFLRENRLGFRLEGSERVAAWVNALDFSPDGKTLAVAAGDEVSLWRIEGRQLLWKFEPPHKEGRATRLSGLNLIRLAFSPDGKLVACAETGRFEADSLWILDASTGRATHPASLDIPEATQLVFRPDGLELSAIGEYLPSRIGKDPNGSRPLFEARVFDPRRGVLLRKKPGVENLAFSADGSLAALIRDGSLEVIDTKTGEVVTMPAVPSGPRIDHVVFSPKSFARRLQSTRLATVSLVEDATEPASITLWDSRNGREAITLQGHLGKINAILFSPDGELLISAGSDGTIRIWDATPLPADRAGLHGKASSAPRPPDREIP